MKRIFGILTALAISMSAFAADCEEAMSKDRFDALYKTIELKKDDSSRTRLIIAYASRECISVAQYNEMMQLVEEHKSRVYLSNRVYAHIFDKENFNLILDQFEGAEKLAIEKEIGRAHV